MERNLRRVLTIGRRIPLDHEVETVLRNVSAISEYPSATGLYKVEAQRSEPFRPIAENSNQDRIDRDVSDQPDPTSPEYSGDDTELAEIRRLCRPRDIDIQLVPVE